MHIYCGGPLATSPMYSANCTTYHAAFLITIPALLPPTSHKNPQIPSLEVKGGGKKGKLESYLEGFGAINPLFPHLPAGRS